MVRGLFEPEEAKLLQQAMETDPQVREHFYNHKDAEGLATKMALWNHPGDSVYGWPRAAIALSTPWNRCLGARSTITTRS